METSECAASKPVSLELAHPKSHMCGVSSHFEKFFLIKIEFIFSITFPIWKPYLFLKNTQKVVTDQEELLKITWKSFLLGFRACWSKWWWLEVCLSNGLRDKACILLNNGNFVKKKSPHFGVLPPSLLLPLCFALSRWNLILFPPKISLTFP